MNLDALSQPATLLNMPAKKSPPAKKLAVLVTMIERRIYLIRGQKVMIDSDQAELYGVETKLLNRGVRRNLERFPEDFMFQLTKDEEESLRIQFGTLKPAGRGQHRKYLPYVFTEQGVAMLSSVLNSKRAIEVNIAIMRAFMSYGRCSNQTSSSTASLLPSSEN